MTTYPTPASATRADARQRAVRTFLQGLATDAAGAVVAVLATELSGVQWTQGWWYALGGLLAKTAVMTVVSYVSRRVLPPSRLPSA